MKNKILKLFCTSAVLCAGLLNAGVINAEEEGTYTETVINNIGLGNVAISLREYMHDAEGNEIPFVNPDAVVPNETITKIAKITNDGNKAWIRAKVSIESDDGLQVDKTLLEISDDKNWLSVGDYYYYTKPVDTGETVTILKSVYVPAEWGSETARKKFNVIVQADAVQEANFTPDFKAQDPWFGTIIETSVYDTAGDITTDNKRFTLTFAGGAEGLFANAEDLFENWADLMPGDTVEDKLIVQNNYTSTISLWFGVDKGLDNDLDEEVHLQIKAGDATIFDGTMAEAKREFILVHLEAGAMAVLSFKVEVPSSLTNKYSFSTAQTVWNFRAELHDRTYSKRTGVGAGAVAAGVVGIVAIGLLVVVLKKKKQEEK